jgi:Mrp family chromosome partitioning ATPase
MIEQHHRAESVTPLRAVDMPLEQPVDVRRYVNALRRSWLLIVATVATLTAVVLVLSLALPKTYSARATILLDENPGITAAADAERQLATIQTLLTTRDVLARAARRLPGETADTLGPKVHASVDPNANIVRISASAGSPRAAARIANAVAKAFLTRQQSLELRRLEAARARLVNALARLRGTPAAKPEIALIRERISEIGVSEASAGSDLQLADAARPPTAADSPQPFRNAIFAFAAGIFIAVLAALGRARLAPRVAGSRELERLSGRPILSVLPQPRRHGSSSAADTATREAFQSLAAVVDAHLPSRQQQIVLVTSIVTDAAAPSVTAGLARALAQAGETTLVVDADLRRPALEQLLGMEPAPGLSEILAAAHRGDAEAASGMIADPPASASARRAGGSLAVLGAGEGTHSSFVSADALEVFFDELRRSAFTYVVIQAPPVLRAAESQLWVSRVDAVVVVSHPEELVPGQVVEAHERLTRAGAQVLGHVAVGDEPA